MQIELLSSSHHYQIQPDEAKKIFNHVENDMNDDPYSDEGTYYFLLNFYLKEYLLEHTDFNFILDICHLGKTYYKYIFDQFLNIFPEILNALKTRSHFTIDMIEQGWDNYYHFTFNDGFYLIHATNIYGADVGKNETIKIDDALFIFYQIKNTFLNLIQRHLNDDFYQIYKKYLYIEDE
ncbi:hypothetical protein [Acinetobacter sp. CFCC 10889]|uniref:hypothetical protein n=1 Tax=Acinetobacter sp. CFCC 10889 TaxID=1775557 RepID=UPI000DD08BE4|nr:hypothetical protein [Acinetobacter sp. CFCC 10889]